MALEHRVSPRSPLAYAALALSIAALMLAVFATWRASRAEAPGATQPESTFAKIKRERLLRVGYGPFPPYTIINANEQDPSKRVSGFCVDMINEIARRQEPPWKVEWQPLAWEALRAEMYSGRFDLLPNAIYQTVPRASEFLFSEPFTYVGVAVAIVKADENRIKEFADLNKPGITVSLAEGWTATEYARQQLAPERLLVKPVGDDLNAQLNDLLSGRADAVLQDVPTALSYRAAHPNAVKILWLENPPIRAAASFITRWEDAELMAFLNTAIRVLQDDGTIVRLDSKWKGMGEYPAPTFKPGAGLRQ
jgi:ABC-type amino acid transport substrate-binding protein